MNTKKTNVNHRIQFPIILVSILLFLIIGFGKYYLGIKHSQRKLNTSQQSQPSQTARITANDPIPVEPSSISTIDPKWKTYDNQQLGISLKHPNTLFLKEFDNWVVFSFEPFSTEDYPGPENFIQISLVDQKRQFFYLFEAKQGDDVPQAHGAVDVIVTKIRNLKFGKYEAVEYIRDGITPPNSGAGRGPIGYEHCLLIKKSDYDYLQFCNYSMKIEKLRQQDIIFNDMVASLQVK